MANKHPILKGLGLLTGFVLVVFAAAFFYAYLTGGDAKALSLLAGDIHELFQLRENCAHRFFVNSAEPCNLFQRDWLACGRHGAHHWFVRVQG